MKEISDKTQFFLFLLLAAITFFIWGWSENGRFQFHVEKGGALNYLIDSRSGRIKLFHLTGDLRFEHLDTIEPPRKYWFPEPEEF